MPAITYSVYSIGSDRRVAEPAPADAAQHAGDA